MAKKYYIFDELGDRWEVHDIQAMLDELLDDDLEVLYKSTRYFHELEMAKIELISLGLLTQVEGEEYNPTAVVEGADEFAKEIVKRLGQESLDTFDAEVDVTWKANKPDLSKYKQQTEETDNETEE